MLAAVTWRTIRHGMVQCQLLCCLRQCVVIIAAWQEIGNRQLLFTLGGKWSASVGSACINAQRDMGMQNADGKHAGGRRPDAAAEPRELEGLGYKIVAYPLSLLGMSIRAMQGALASLKV